MLRVLALLGRVMVTGGILTLAFVAHELWATELHTSNAQSNLADAFAQHSSPRRTSPSTPSSSSGTTPSSAVPSTTTTTTPTRPAPAVPAEGDVLARITIPRISLDAYVVEGVSVDDLRRGPGHYSGTPLPGQPGNAAIAGHRTTYGAPFGSLDELAAGDEILIAYPDGPRLRFTVDASDVVAPSALSVLDPVPDASQPGTFLTTLTLTTCHPKLSAAKRLVVWATLDPGTTALAPDLSSLGVGTTDAFTTSLSADLSGESASKAPMLVWGIVCAAIGAAWLFVFRRSRRLVTWLAGAVPFVATLYVFFNYLERALPANY